VTGLLLINLGTPDEPETAAVRRYLRQFLSDPRVIDINPLGRWLLLNLIILPTRPAKSAHAYRQIWDATRGSPLLSHSEDLTARVRARLGAGWQVELAMRYGKPSIEEGLAKMRAAGVDRIVVLPLFPQYASSSTGSAVEEAFRIAGAAWNVPALSIVDAFYEHPGFLDAFAAVGRPVIEALRADHVLFSFHGLPERQIQKSDESGRHCLQSAGCCDQIGTANRNCYRAQSYATARGIASRLGLEAERWSVSFQSRLGRTPWIKPYTDVVLDELAARGIKRLAVYCPAFVADCLETLEEIGMRARDQFRAKGGEELVLVPSLNSSEPWVEAVIDLVARHGQRLSPAGAGSEASPAGAARTGSGSKVAS
jgi:protoporphyrin/coproporphyrin ferrochelatase